MHAQVPALSVRSLARLSLAFVSFALFAARPALARIVWEGGFEDGTRSEWGRYHAVPSTPPRINVIARPAGDAPRGAGSLAARVEVRTGDDARKLDPTTGKVIGGNDYNERAELQVPNDALGHAWLRDGDDVWMSWQTMFPSDRWWGLDPKGGGTIFWQIHHVRLSDDSYDGSPPLMFVADNNELRVSQCASFPCAASLVRHREKLRRDHWYTFVVHAKHSTRAADGRLEVWIDGVRQVNLETPLLFGANFGNYVMAGQYRRPGTARTGVLYMDDFVMGTAREDVFPPPPPPPPPPAPIVEGSPLVVGGSGGDGADDGGAPAPEDGDAEPTEAPAEPGLAPGELVSAPAAGGCSSAGPPLAFALGALALGVARRRRRPADEVPPASASLD